MAEREWKLPQREPQECRSRAEELLALPDVNGAATHAIAWALLAIAGELHEAVKQLRRR